MTPSIKDYLKWMIIPSLIGMVTCGIGSLIIIIVWATDTKNMARANYFRALLVLTGLGIAIAFLGIMIISALATSAIGIYR